MRSPRCASVRRSIAALLLLLAVAPASAATVVKMATLVPDGSVWDKALKEMGAQWKADTGGEVALRLYAGGVAGDEPDIVRKMRIGQLHAAALTVVGLSLIDPAFEIFQLPMFYRDYDELFHVLDALRPALAERLEQRGFVLLNWGHAGWIHLFAKEPIRTVDDLRAQKMYFWSGDDALLQLWRKNGFQPVALAATDILPGLQTGMIAALPTTPLAALSLQWFRQTPYMQDLGLAPLVGALVVSNRTWKKIAPAHQARLRTAATAVETKLQALVPDQDRRAVEEMAERGLTVVTVDEAVASTWRAVADDFARAQSETMAEGELLAEARRLRDAYRARRESGR